MIGIFFTILYFKKDHDKIIDKYNNKININDEEIEIKTTTTISNPIKKKTRLNLNLNFNRNNTNNNKDINSQEKIKNNKYNEKDSVKDYSNLNYKEALEKDKRNIFIMFCNIFFEKICFGMDIDCKNLKYCSILKFIKIILIFFSIHTYLFISAFLFSDKYISERYLYKGKIEGIGHFTYILINEIERIINTFLMSLIIIKILRWILYEKSYEYLDKLSKNKFTLKRLKLIKGFYICKSYFFLIIILFVQLIYLYFILIFGNINSYTQLDLIFSMILSLMIYIGFCLVFAIIISILRKISLECGCDLLYQITILISNIL